MPRKTLSKRRGEQRAKTERQAELEALVDVARRLGVEVRFARGYFRSGSCLVGGKSMIIINRRLTVGGRIEILLRELADRDLEQIFIRPEVREKIRQAKESK